MLSFDQVKRDNVIIAAESAEINYDVLMDAIRWVAQSTNPNNITTKDIADEFRLLPKPAITIHRIVREQLHLNTGPQAGKGKILGENEVFAVDFSNDTKNREGLHVVFTTQYAGSTDYPLDYKSGIFKMQKGDVRLKGLWSAGHIKHVQSVIDLLSIDPMLKNAYLKEFSGCRDSAVYAIARATLGIREHDMKAWRKRVKYVAPITNVKDNVPVITRALAISKKKTATTVKEVQAEFFETSDTDAEVVIFSVVYNGNSFYPLSLKGDKIRIKRSDPRLRGKWGEKTIRLVQRTVRALSTDPLLTNDLLVELLGATSYTASSIAKDVLGIKRDVRAARKNAKYVAPKSLQDLEKNAKERGSISFKSSDEAALENATEIIVVDSSGVDINLLQLGTLVGRDPERKFFAFEGGVMLVENGFAAQEGFGTPDGCTDVFVIEEGWSVVEDYTAGLEEEEGDLRIYENLVVETAPTQAPAPTPPVVLHPPTVKDAVLNEIIDDSDRTKFMDFLRTLNLDAGVLKKIENYTQGQAIPAPREVDEFGIDEEVTDVLALAPYTLLAVELQGRLGNPINQGEDVDVSIELQSIEITKDAITVQADEVIRQPKTIRF